MNPTPTPHPDNPTSAAAVPQEGGVDPRRRPPRVVLPSGVELLLPRRWSK